MTETFEQWCIVELMGRQVIAGKVTEATIGGQSFVRVDVPATDGQEAYTKFYGTGAIYCMTPTTEDVVRRTLEYYKPAPVSVYIPPSPQLPRPYSDADHNPEGRDDYSEEERTIHRHEDGDDDDPMPF